MCPGVPTRVGVVQWPGPDNAGIERKSISLEGNPHSRRQAVSGLAPVNALLEAMSTLLTHNVVLQRGRVGEGLSASSSRDTDRGITDAVREHHSLRVHKRVARIEDFRHVAVLLVGSRDSVAAAVADRESVFRIFEIEQNRPRCIAVSLAATDVAVETPDVALSSIDRRRLLDGRG